MEKPASATWAAWTRAWWPSGPVACGDSTPLASRAAGVPDSDDRHPFMDGHAPGVILYGTTPPGAVDQAPLNTTVTLWPPKPNELLTAAMSPSGSVRFSP